MQEERKCAHFNLKPSGRVRSLEVLLHLNREPFPEEDAPTVFDRSDWEGSDQLVGYGVEQVNPTARDGGPFNYHGLSMLGHWVLAYQGDGIFQTGHLLLGL